MGSDSYGYACDAAGNLVQEATSRHFGWDQASRMRVFRVQVEASGSTPANPRWSEPSVYAQYLYDAAGQRVKKLVRKQGGGYDVAIWIDGGFEVRRSVRAGGTTENRTLHVMDGAKRIALVRTGPALSGDPRPAVTYEVADHLGGSNVVLDAAGTLIDREEYTPYGETSFGSTPLKRYRFTGKERDEESGLSYHGARYYAPWLARWTSPDPVGMIDGPILFAYPANPLRLVDPSGTAGEQPQLHLIQQSELRQPVTATAAGPGFGQPLRQTYQNLGAQWGMSNVHVGHPENMPFALTPAGTTTSVYAQEGGENMSLGASEEKARVQEARANNQFTREKGVDLSAKKGTRYGQPPLVEKLRDVRAPTPGANPKPPVPTPTVQATASASPAQAPAQLSLDFESPKMPASASTPDATTSTAPGASITATVPPSPGKGAAVMGVAKSLAKSLIPGAEYYDELKLAGGGSALLGLKAGISYSWMQVSAAAARASAAVAPILEGAANVGSRLTAPFLIIVDPRLIDPSLGGSSPYGPPPMT